MIRLPSAGLNTSRNPNVAAHSCPGVRSMSALELHASNTTHSLLQHTDLTTHFFGVIIHIAGADWE
jgi:hypothetical protein